MQILNGKELAKKIRTVLKEEVVNYSDRRPPHLVAVLVGEDPASQIYVKNKIKACEEVGIKSSLLTFGASVSEMDLLAEITRLNNDSGIDGIIVQFPLPSHIRTQNISLNISPQKDVDGFHPVNLGFLISGEQGLKPATPAGIFELLKETKVSLKGKHCVVVGRSQTVGLPVSLMMVQKSDFSNCTVTMCHTGTPDIGVYTRQADILIAAAGVPMVIKAEMVKPGAIVIDVGIHRLEGSHKLCGDVDFEQVAPKCSFITPVPGGVGPMTIAMLLFNTYLAYKSRYENQ